MKKLLFVIIFTLFCSNYFESDFQVTSDEDVGPMSVHSSEIENS
jgi:hypothetical protein